MFIDILPQMFFDNAYIIFPYMAFLGLTIGFHAPFTGALWAELYGIINIGSIRALLHSCGVFASALSPFIFGLLIDYNFTVFSLVLFSLLLIVLASIPPFRFRNK